VHILYIGLLHGIAWWRVYNRWLALCVPLCRLDYLRILLLLWRWRRADKKQGGGRELSRGCRCVVYIAVLHGIS
jgi:hypothetical protein